MASNDQWPDVASASKSAAKINGNKRNVKESQQKILSVVNEMFGSALEPDVILQVVQNSSWELQPSIEGLITLTETVETPAIWENVLTKEIIETNKIVAKDGKMEAESAERALRPTSEKPKRGAAKNRMGSFCGNIAKLKSSGENNNETLSEKVVTDSDYFFDDMHRYGASGPKICHESTARPASFGHLPDVAKATISKGIYAPAGELNSPNWVNRKNSHDTRRKETFLDTKTAAEDKEFNKPEEKVAYLEDKSKMRKAESESLCGLKVQYRLSGMENSSDDDDADVVIEDESSDYKINVASSVSISEFLSPSTQTPPQLTQPQIHMINTPSPPQTPQRNIHEATLKRIESAIKTGSKILILLRGLPGSGKTTLARKIVETMVGGTKEDFIFNTDDFFVTLGRGVYKFDPSRLQEAHNTNHKRIWNAMKEGRSPIIADNTNVEAWEMRPYAAMAVENGYIVEILEPNTPWAENVNELAKKNTHKVPKSKIRERYERYERGLTGKKLLDKFSLKYSTPKNIPPQPRRVPPPIATQLEPPKEKPPLVTMADFKSNWGGNEKNNFVLTSQDIESMQNIDESNSYDKVFQDYLQEFQDSDDESFEMLEGGMSQQHEPVDVEKCVKHENESRIEPISTDSIGDAPTKNSSPQQIFGAIGSERKGSLAPSIENPDTAEKSETAVEHEKSDNVLSQCWDFTLLRGRYKIHSRHNMSELDSKFSSNKTVKDGQIIGSNSGELEIEAEKSRAEVNEKIVESSSENRNIVDERESKSDEEQAEENVQLIDSSLLRDALKTDDEIVDKICDDLTGIVDDESEVPSAFGSFLNLIKTSILGPTDEIVNHVDDSSASVAQSQDNDRAHEKEDTKDKDTTDLPCQSEQSDGKKMYSDLSTNPFRKEMLEFVGQRSQELVTTDNINRISWKESPFPIDNLKSISFPIAATLEIQRSVAKVDASTNTTYYDFNVSFVGGTSEPGYRELVATSRCINEGNYDLSKIQSPPTLKLMLDKSSMTSEENILAEESIYDPEDKEKASPDRIQELIELFPHIPVESLTGFYVQQCKRNFDWAVEVLLDDASNAFSLKGFEIKRPRIDNDESTRLDTEKNMKRKEHEKLKQRSHSSSPRHRRNKSKDFRSFSMDFAQDCNWPIGQNSLLIKDDVDDDDEDDDDTIYQQIYAASTANLPLEIPESSSDNEEEMELNFGREFVNQLEKTFGNPDFAFPEEFTPSIRIKKSMAEQLHALWIESMYRQLNARHAQLDEMIAKDEAIARALVREEMREPVKEPVVPNFEEIMDMEMALASYKNELKEKIARETPNDLASRLSRQMLYESLPDIDQQTLSEILKAHDGNFKETCETIETSTGRKISKSESLKKQQSLLDRVNEESKNRQQKSTPLIVVRPEVSSTAGGRKSSEKYELLERGREARKEAEKQFSLRIDYFNKAAEAYRKGYPDVAAYYSQMAKLHSENIEAAHAEAAEAFLSAQICANDEDNTLDLHNLFVPEALQALDIFLEQQSKKLSKGCKKSLILFIITGRGARSNNGLSRIKPAVTNKLISRNIRFTEANPGCLKVTLSKKKGD